MWSVISVLYPPKGKPVRASSYTDYENDFNLDGINFPMTSHQVEKFEKLNNVSISVYEYDQKSKPSIPYVFQIKS